MSPPRRTPAIALVAALALAACSPAGSDVALERAEPRSRSMTVGEAQAPAAQEGTATGPAHAEGAPSTGSAPGDAPAADPGAAGPQAAGPGVAPTTPDLFALRPPAPAGGPEELAARIAAAEGTIRDPASSEAQVAEAALFHQSAYRQLGDHPEWDAAVMTAVPPHLSRVVELNVAARREFRAMHTKLSPTLPAWHIVAPPPHADLMAMYREAEAAFGIPWKYLAAIQLVETGTGRIRGTSSAGAQGPMQFMPATWAAYGAGGDIHDNRDAIMAAGRYLAANNGAVDIDHALFRYNRSQRYVRGVRLYADLIAENPRAASAYYWWGVWYLTDQGSVYLPVGYREPTPVAVADHLSRP